MTSQAGRRSDIPKAYDPRAVEERLYRFWEERGHFTPRIDPQRRPFTIIMPPPNVSGDLHLGSAMFITLEDVLTRWHRMRGEPTLWLPGQDHAAIATQNVVERELASEGLDRHELGRERFLERVWDWVHQYRAKIRAQLRRLGASCDWTRERFTMDPGPQKAVRTTFVRLYNDGLIYRGERIINWCPRCQTALSDLEVEHRESQSHLWYVRYPLIEEKPGAGNQEPGPTPVPSSEFPVPQYITIATTRPETIVADVGVAVNPKDGRYQSLLGRKALLPIINREIVIVADEAIDPEFGTGALKVTPGHDPVDFEIGQRHGLPVINSIALDATMTEEAGPYRGMDRFECRRALVRDLEEGGYLVKTEPYSHSIGHCQRCDTIIEPLISPQWYVKMAPLAAPAIEVVSSGRLRFVPERFTRVYLNWMENIRDWCISRQLWFGHAIPVWYCDDCRGQMASVEDPSRCRHCGSARLRQDSDVLDTWFSSALWPHSTLGWPDETEDLAYFYPTSVMETGYDIIFFWVARMVMMGLYNMKEVPFHTVYLHGLVRDERGEKISKSKVGRTQAVSAAIEDVVGTYGTDALRYALATGGSPGNDMKISEQKLEAGRNFANKLWNAARFVLTNLDGAKVERPSLDRRQAMPLEDRWIMSRLQRVTASVSQLLERFELGEAGRQLHDFLWGEYCDWYVEMAKVRLRGEPGTRSQEPGTGSREQGSIADSRPVLVHVLDSSLRLLHPYMPYVTEEIWQALAGHLPDRDAEALIVARFPQPDPAWHDDEVEAQAEAVIEVVRAIRNIRSERRVEPARFVEAHVQARRLRPALEASRPLIAALARVEPLHIVGEEARLPSENVATAVLPDGRVALPLAGLFDLEAERGRLSRQIGELEGEVSRLAARLADERFRTRAPAAVVRQEEERLASARSRLEGLRARLSELG
jgi:valyl-tRNA synthetase